MTTRYYCDACGWEGEDPVLNEIQGSGCGGVLWTLCDCPECGEEASQIAMHRDTCNSAEQSPSNTA